MGGGFVVEVVADKLHPLGFWAAAAAAAGGGESTGGR